MSKKKKKSINSNHVKMQKFTLLIITFLLIGSTVFAQKATIEGTVKTSNGESLPSATILVKGTTNGTLSDVNGHFTIKAEPKDLLVASYIGFETVEVTVGNQKVINIILEDSKQEIKEVVVTALGIEKEKSTIGFSIQDVKGAELVKAREPNAINALTGKVAGLTVGASSEMLELLLFCFVDMPLCMLLTAYQFRPIPGILILMILKATPF